MDKKFRLKTKEPYDAIIIGAGISGVIFLKYARKKGLNCLILEKQNDAGGLWNWIPAWQDIQNRKEDFAINNIPLKGDKQPEVHDYIQTWIRKFELDPFIKLNCEVSSVSRADDHWQVQTNDGEYNSRYLIIASGVQNRPWIPDVKRTNSEIKEMHSSEIKQPEDLANKRIAVVGSGASALDLLDLAIGNGAKNVHWIYRNTRWFFPSYKSKQKNPLCSLRILSVMQTLMKSPEKVSETTQKILQMKYKQFKVKSIQPNYNIDMKKHQLFPGRPLMTRNINAIARHQSEIDHIEGHEITLRNKERIETDMILWGTGYRMNLDYLGLPEFQGIKTVKQLYPRLGSLIRSLDYPNLFFTGMCLIESNSSTPFLVAVEAKSIVSHILGKCEIPKKNIPYNVNHWHLFRLFAAFDHASYPRFWWHFKYFMLAFWYAVFPKKLVTI